MGEAKRELELPAGTIRYREAGEGPPIVFVHGFLVDGRLWDGVVEGLSDRFRCIAPDLPFGAHRLPLSPAADLSPYGVAALISSLLDALDLNDVTIVGNDSGGAMSQVFVTRHPERVGRLVLTNCDTHENFPPGPFKALPPLVGLPGAMLAISAPLRVPALARAAFRPFTRDPLPPELIASWVEPSLGDAAIRRDTQKFLAGMHKRYTLEAAEKLRAAELPLLLIWGTGDRVFRVEHAERLQGESPEADLVRIEGARTFLPLDEPRRVAEQIALFRK